MKIKTVVVALALVCLMLSLLIQIPVASASPDKPPKPHPKARWSEKLQAWIYPTPKDDKDFLTSVAAREGGEVEDEPLEPQDLDQVTTESLPSKEELVSDVYNAKTYTNQLFESWYVSGVKKAVCREYQASRVGLWDITGSKWNLAGWDGSSDIIEENTIAGDKELLNYRYKELTTGTSNSPLLWVDRYYYGGGSPYTRIIVSIRDYDGTHHVNVYFEEEVFFYDAQAAGCRLYEGGPLVGYPQTFTVDYYNTNLESYRYTMRHGSQLVSNINKVWQIPSKYQPLDSLLSDYGFTVDIYDPLWKMSNSYSNLFMFSAAAYHDCDVYNSLPRMPSDQVQIYPYKSKVMINRDLYISESCYDPLLKCLWVIHLLNKYGQPDTAYYYPYPVSPPLYFTPRDMMRAVERDHWDGDGIVYGYEQYVTVRLAVFSICETVLGYKFGDTTSKPIAQRTIEILHQLQTSNSAGEFESKDYGVCIRPQHRGGFLVAYVTGQSYAFAYPERDELVGWLFDLIKGIFGWSDMPPETKGLVPCNTETTSLSLQAIRVFLHYHYAYDYPNSSYIP